MMVLHADLRERPRSQGAFWAVCGSGVSLYEFSICMVFLTESFARETAEKRLDLKSLKRQTKAEELGQQLPQFLSLRLSLKAL